ncbi:hypothetical protein [Ruminococcus sp.]|uniref:hypothetical protein n=1 Tax=Ruminococcus sp. TaxID=41978 RepID=UPI002E782533|nr:hypothetical protein [Ruminococcus sp.]MEE1264090.1 hypothetical protein [Ruminococcus sp.]
MNVTFLNGADVTVRADGVVVGGVIKAETGQKNTVDKIEEYLTDVPVAQFSETSYYIKLTMKAQPYGTLGLDPGEVSLSCGGCRVVYTGCCVQNVKCEILPNSAVQYTVLISAGERSVENV